MKSKSIHLDIQSPCHESWQAMQPVSDGRFCQSCQKTVLDFSGMSDREVASFFQNHQGSACGKFRPDQLRRPLRMEQPARCGFGLRALSLLVPGLLAGSLVRGQTADTAEIKAKRAIVHQQVTLGMVVRETPEKTSQNQQWKLKGMVTDEVTGEPLIFANIQVKGTKYGTSTDLDGTFEISIWTRPATLIVSYVGYETKEILVNGNEEKLTVSLKTDNQAMMLVGEIVTRPKDQTLWSLARTEFHELKRKLRRQKRDKKLGCSANSAAVVAEPAPMPETEAPVASASENFSAKVFPNPFDESLTVEMALPKTEALHLRLLDLH
ncbi:MAG: carboxypeptidase-like regulatory domain-containing protein, partial [Bacteroidota bacterium]